MALTITGRLLCAAVHTYRIVGAGQTPDSPPHPAPPPSGLVGYLNPPHCYVAGDDRIDAALFGETDSEFILAFRGTEPPDSPDHQQAILDWANDLNAVPVAAADVPGVIHPGFLGSLNRLWPLLWPVVKQATQANPSKPLYITGHSKGGAIAPLAAWRCQQNGVVPLVCTFAAAKCGDQAFASAYNQHVPHSVRYEFQDDIVPHLPPGAAFRELAAKVPWFGPTAQNLELGYVHVGALQFINWQGQVEGESALLYVERAASLVKLMLTFGLGTIIADHGLDPGSGYARAACPGTWSA